MIIFWSRKNGTCRGWLGKNLTWYEIYSIGMIRILLAHKRKPTYMLLAICQGSIRTTYAHSPELSHFNGNFTYITWAKSYIFILAFSPWFLDRVKKWKIQQETSRVNWRRVYMGKVTILFYEIELVQGSLDQRCGFCWISEKDIVW